MRNSSQFSFSVGLDCTNFKKKYFLGCFEWTSIPGRGEGNWGGGISLLQLHLLLVS